MSPRRRPTPLLLLAAVALTACGDEVPSSSGDQVASPTTTDGSAESTTPSTATTSPATSPTTSPATSTMPTDDTAPPTEPTTAPTTEETTVPPTTSSASSPDDGAHPAIVTEAIADLREMLGAPDASIEVISVEEVTWSDGSIGCPQPGRAYTQALVNGSRIVLRHDGVDYAYHQGGSARVFHCPDELAKQAPPANLDI